MFNNERFIDINTKKKIIISGIYQIKNKINNKIYIGSTINIERRWKDHIRDLKRNAHHSIKLQRAWNKYGGENFEFSVLEECIPERLLYVEQFYIDKYKVFYEGYNCKEKTKELFTAADYERYILYGAYSEILLDVYNDYLLSFSDNKTKNRIIANKYINNEYIWYTDIICFVETILKHYNRCRIKNSQDLNSNYFIDFDYLNGSNKLNFVVFIKDLNLAIDFVYFVNERYILHSYCYKLNEYHKKLFERELNFNNKVSEFLLGKLYDMSTLDIQENNLIIKLDTKDKYFQFFSEAFNPLHVKDMYEYYLVNYPELLYKIFDYYKRNNINLAHRVYY